ncbi:MAG: TonB-dependent receptor, partial [Bacteroidetes bacterium]
MKNIILLFCLLMSGVLSAQQYVVKGTVTDGSEAIGYCNIYMENSLNGTYSDLDGNFELMLTHSDQPVKIIFSYVGCQNYELVGTPKELAAEEISIVLNYDASLDEIVVFGEKKVEAGYISGLSSIDIITTPTALGDALAAISSSLPGNQIDPNDGRFFVRGGDHYETKIFVNDMNVHTPFNTNGPNMPNRGRFSPFLFDGMSFSAGGFEAEYGRALSSVLLMDTKDAPKKEEMEVSVKSVGIDAGINKIITDDFSLTATAEYTHLGPYRSLFPSRYEWHEDYNTLAGEVSSVVNLGNNGTFKTYNKYDQTRLDYERFDLGFGRDINTKIYENNFYSNNVAYVPVNDKFKLTSGFVFSHNQRDIYGVFSHADNSFVIDKLMHFKSKGEYHFDDINLKVKAGVEVFLNTYSIDYTDNFTENQFFGEIDNHQLGSFVDLEWKLAPKIKVKTGVRYDHSFRMQEDAFSPRVRLEYEIFPNFTASPYAGVFHQVPQNGHLIFDFEKNLQSERADQYGFNAFWKKDKRVMFLDIYKKDYSQLVKYDFESNGTNPSNFNNLGSGYANGLDFFFWDRKTFKNLEYRVSYTLIDAKRDYETYPGIVYPRFYSKHNASAVVKYWSDKLRSLISVSYTYSSGRPYTNPN